MSTKIIIFTEEWCPGRDLNPQDQSRGILSPLCLPISPPGQVLVTNCGRNIAEDSDMANIYNPDKC